MLAGAGQVKQSIHGERFQRGEVFGLRIFTYDCPGSSNVRKGRRLSTLPEELVVLVTFLRESRCVVPRGAGTRSTSHVLSLVRVVEFGAHDNASSERNFSVAWFSSHRHESETRNLAHGELTSLSVQIVEPDPSAAQCGVGSCCTARDCKGNLARLPGDH